MSRRRVLVLFFFVFARCTNNPGDIPHLGDFLKYRITHDARIISPAMSVEEKLMGAFMRGTVNVRLATGLAVALVVTVVPSFSVRADHESGGSIPILEQTSAVSEAATNTAFSGRKPEEIHQALRDLWRSDPLFMQPDDSEVSYDTDAAASARGADSWRELALSSRQ